MVTRLLPSIMLNLGNNVDGSAWTHHHVYSGGWPHLHTGMQPTVSGVGCTPPTLALEHITTLYQVFEVVLNKVSSIVIYFVMHNI